MKISLLIIALLSVQLYASEQYAVKSKIKNVIVYQQGAQIKRQGNFTAKKGTTELIISGISAQIDINTLQVNATGNIVILDSKHKINYPEPILQNNLPNVIPPKIKKEIQFLQDSLFDLSYEIAALQNEIDVLNSQKRIIENNGTIKGQGKVNDSIELLSSALTFYHKEMNSINSALLKLNKRKTIFIRYQSRMNTRLTALNNYNSNNQLTTPANPEPIHEIIITVSAKETTTGRINVTYLVNGAGWTPLYDLRSNNKAATIDLTYKAQVYQNTGINWENTRLSLSTNNPYSNKTKPAMNPWYLDYYAENNYNNKKEVQPYASVESTSATSAGNLYSRDALNKDADLELEEAMTADQFVTTVEQLVVVEYAIDLPYTIKSNNEKNMVLVKTSSLKTDYKYYTVPKLDPSVYLIAQITNLDALNLIPGKATIFHDGSYLGTTYISPNTLRDTMDLSLGKTTNITVKRSLIKNATKEKIVGEKILKTFAYEIAVKNINQKSITLIVEDQIPVSRNEEIEVEAEDLSKGKLNPINGFVRWEQRVKAGALSKYKLVYSVSYEKTKPLNLVNN